MRSRAEDFVLQAPPTLDGVLRLLQEEPGRHALLAGGTELMVAFNTGRLSARSLLSLQNVRELRFIEAGPRDIRIGAGTTFTDLRRRADIVEALPLLAQAASWTGSIANQNRGTLGGNIVNASPAADSPPALLVYEAELHLLSLSGMRTLPYSEFHLGYKRTALRPEELLHSISVPRPAPELRGYIRKVGTRNAQAISKIALAGLARIESGVIAEMRLAAASLADRPIRLQEAEAALAGKPVDPDTIAAACRALAREARPIDDIRSTARYRTAVAANLLRDFLSSLAT